MTSDFDGPDLLVGEITAVRTFDLRADGTLWPVFAADRPWSGGENEAHCGLHETAAAPGCRCGYWAYGSTSALRDQTRSHNVVAVVSCWGRVTPGTRGLRARFARIEAIWLSRRVSRELVERVAERYPQAPIYRDRARLLAEHPLTAMPSYVADPRFRLTRSQVARRLIQAILVASILLGLLPAGIYHAHPFMQSLLVQVRLMLVYAGVGAVIQVLALFRRNAGQGQILVRVLPPVVALLLWLWAPFTPLVAGLALRLPAALWLGRILVNRTVRYLPTRVGRAAANPAG